MGGWFIPESCVDKILCFWNENKQHKQKGVVLTTNKHIIEKKIKDAECINIIPNYIYEPWVEYENHLQKCLDNYIKKYPFAGKVPRFSLKERYLLQGYKKQGGYKDMHCENGGTKTTFFRHLVFMTYLNDIENGGTHFPEQDITTPSKKGLTLIWSAHFTHPHRSQVCNEPKQIVTGWFSFNSLWDSRHAINTNAE